MINETLKNLTKLRIAGLLSEAARLEVEERIMQARTAESSKELDKLSFS